jgi:hypothetical protein
VRSTKAHDLRQRRASASLQLVHTEKVTGSIHMVRFARDRARNSKEAESRHDQDDQRSGPPERDPAVADRGWQRRSTSSGEDACHETNDHPDEYRECDQKGLDGRRVTHVFAPGFVIR